MGTTTTPSAESSRPAGNATSMGHKTPLTPQSSCKRFPTPPRSTAEKYRARRTTPKKNLGKKSPNDSGTSYKKTVTVDQVDHGQGLDSESLDEREFSFTDHTELCHRVAKSLYFANKLPNTPRPSLPLTILAVNTFTRSARKDTLEFLDMEKAAEIGRNACVSPTALIMALVYLERLSAHNPGYLKSAKPSELFVVSLLVASKFIQDDGEELGIFNDEWATSADIELKKLNRLELDFLTAINWNVNVLKDEYDTTLGELENRLAMKEGMCRGWFTYAELGTLTNSILSWNLIWPTLYTYCVKVVTAACMTYATLLVTIWTSSIMAPHIFHTVQNYMTITSNIYSSNNNPIIARINQNNFHSHSRCLANSTPITSTSCLTDEDEDMNININYNQNENLTDISFVNIAHLESTQFLSRSRRLQMKSFPQFNTHHSELNSGFQTLGQLSLQEFNEQVKNLLNPSIFGEDKIRKRCRSMFSDNGHEICRRLPMLSLVKV